MVGIFDLPKALMERIVGEFRICKHPSTNAALQPGPFEKPLPTDHRLKAQPLSRISQVCREWRKLSQPLLYATYVKSENLAYPENEKVQLSRSLRLFLRTLMERPDLAKHVNHLILGPWESSHPLTHIDTNSHHSLRRKLNEKLAIRQRMHRTSPPIGNPFLERLACWSNKPGWRRLLSNTQDHFDQDEDVEVALLLTLLPHSRDLKIHVANQMTALLFAVLEEAAIKEPQHFSQLETISVYAQRRTLRWKETPCDNHYHEREN